MRADDSKSGQGGIGLHGVDGVGEHVGGRVVLHVLRHAGVGAANESKVYAASLAACAHQNHIGPVSKPLLLPYTSSSLASHSKVVPASDGQRCLVLFGDALYVDEVGRS